MLSHKAHNGEPYFDIKRDGWYRHCLALWIKWNNVGAIAYDKLFFPQRGIENGQNRNGGFALIFVEDEK